jgi:hypothetical protein
MRILRLSAITLMATVALVTGTAAASSAATKSAQPAPAQVTSSVRMSQASVVTPFDTRPQGTYDTSVTFCDARDHQFWSGLTYFVVYYNGSGRWQGRNYQDYDVVDCTFGGCWDIGYYYRWC